MARKCYLAIIEWLVVARSLGVQDLYLRTDSSVYVKNKSTEYYILLIHIEKRV